MPKGNVPYKFSQEAQDERDWKSQKTRVGENYNCAKYNKKKYQENYDQIDWNKK